jgi:hypothetical protein
MQGSRSEVALVVGSRSEQDAWLQYTVQGGSSAWGKPAWANPLGSGFRIVVTKLLLSVAKVATAGSIGALIYYSAAPLGLPIGNTWFDGFIVGYGVNVVLGSAVSSMVEPDEDVEQGLHLLLSLRACASESQHDVLSRTATCGGSFLRSRLKPRRNKQALA